MTQHYQNLVVLVRSKGQQVLAEKAEVPRQTVMDVDAGKYCPSMGLAFPIAKIFTCPIFELLSYGTKGDDK
ncbi:MAG: transcriptional regulator [Spirochaetia bacterium]|jgi:DNA-binding XRE family transcriptional regulator|nr:transcriptional regulator [Spirochaetia bacterium]